MYITPLIAPKSVALIGASNREGSLGYEMMEMIAGTDYEGEVYPINPRYEEILGFKCYPDLESIGKPVDLVVLSVAARRLLDQVDIIIENKARSIVIFANAVLEEDPTLEDKLLKKLKDANIPVMGHNAMGYYNNDISLRICGFKAPDEGVKGNISFISQSGSVFSTVGHNEPQLKFNLMVATGTGQITALEDYILYALDQPSTKVIGVYMESVRKPETFIKALKTAAEKKVPIVAMKVGRSKLGAQFAQSHTGGLAGNDDAFQAIFDHYGVIRVDSIQELSNTLALFSYYPSIPKGGVVAIADSGGERNLLADDAEYVDLEYTKLSEKTMEELESIQEYGQDAANPLDPWGTGIDFEKIFGDSLVTMLNDENSAIGIISQDLRDGYYLSEGCIEALEQGHKETGKPVAFLTNLGGTRRVKCTEIINKIPAPVLVGSREGLKAVKNYLEFRDFVFEERNESSFELSQEGLELLKSKDVLTEIESINLLDSLEFPVVKPILLDSLNKLEKEKDNIMYPVVLKTAEEGILHKADVGGVKLNLKNYEEVKTAYDGLSSRLGEKAIIAPMVSFDSEFIFGMIDDPTFGPLVLVGAGGTLTELLKDKVVLVPNAGVKEIERKVRSLKTYPLLTGFRGMEEVDIDAFVQAIVSFCKVVETLGDSVKEIDINPVAVKGNTIVALDSLIVVK